MGTAETPPQTEETPPQSGESNANAPQRSVWYALAHKLVLPTAIFVLAILYVENTYDSIDPEHLLYPYFIIALLGFSLLAVYVRDIRQILNEYRNIDEYPSIIQSMRNAITENKKPLQVMVSLVIYVELITLIGFLLASLLCFVTMTKILGDESITKTFPIALVVVGTIYGLFVVLLGISAPTGLFGI
jgi:uncharacterized membrane protein (DUF485 family)